MDRRSNQDPEQPLNLVRLRRQSPKTPSVPSYLCEGVFVSNTILCSLHSRSIWRMASFEGTVQPFSQRFTVAKLTPRASAIDSCVRCSRSRSYLTRAPYLLVTLVIRQSPEKLGVLVRPYTGMTPSDGESITCAITVVCWGCRPIWCGSCMPIPDDCA